MLLHTSRACGGNVHNTYTLATSQHDKCVGSAWCVYARADAEQRLLLRSSWWGLWCRCCLSETLWARNLTYRDAHRATGCAHFRVQQRTNSNDFNWAGSRWPRQSDNARAHQATRLRDINSSHCPTSQWSHLSSSLLQLSALLYCIS